MTTAEVSDEDFQEILAQTRHFVRTAVVPREQEILASDKVPDDLREQAKKMGLFGYAIPQEWGGLGLNLAQDVELAMELGYTSLALRSMFGTNNGIAGQVLVGFGTDEQKARWLEPMASGDVVASFALTEPGAGSNPSGLRTKAVRDGSDWIINGQKRFITNAPTADLFIVFARTRPADDDGPGIAVFLVPADAAGVAVGAKDAKMGQEGAWTADVSFDDVRVPDARADRRQRRHRLPGRDDLAGARPRAHRRAGGRDRATRPRRIRRVRRHRDAGWNPDREFPTGAGDARRPADGVLAGRALVRDTAGCWVSGEDRRIAPSAAKLFCTEMVGKVADLAVQIHGGSGYMREVPVERIYRDVRLLRLYEGTSEIQRLIIGSNLVKAAQNDADGSPARWRSLPGRRGARVARMPCGWPTRAPTSSPSTSQASCRRAFDTIPRHPRTSPKPCGSSRPPAAASSPPPLTPGTSRDSARPSMTVWPTRDGSTSSWPMPASPRPGRGTPSRQRISAMSSTST